MWRNITSNSANDTLAITCRMKIGRASCTLTHMRRLTSSPMSPALSLSARPNWKLKSEIERSQKIVSVTFSLPALGAFQYSGLS